MNGIQLNWRRNGYFFDSGLLKTCTRDWLQWAHLFDQARQGDFTGMPDLLDLYLKTDDILLRDACSKLLGDAGTSEAIGRTASFLRSRFAELDPVLGDEALDFANVLGVHGQLLFVPELLLVFEWNLGLSDSRIFALLLSRMLEAEWGPLARCPRREDAFPEYQRQVMKRMQALTRTLKSKQAYVFMGEATHAPWTARLLLQNRGDSHFEEASQSVLRRHFEASTGVNCTQFFKEERFQPLTAAAVLEEFLASPEAMRFVPGRKYFFGHQVP